MMRRRATQHRLTRRSFLRASGGLLAGAYVLGLAGCGGEEGKNEASGEIQIPDSGANLPEENVTFRWIETGPGARSPFVEQYFEAYEEAHPNITVELDQLPGGRVRETVSLGIRNGTAHDVFPLAAGLVSAGQAVRDGWVQPIDDYIPNFEEWKAAFPPNSFVEGVQIFNGKTYSFPIISEQRYSTLLLYNRELLERAGYDPESEPLTWDEYREAARTVTEQGNGNYYGVIFGGATPAQWELFVSSLAHMAGATAMENPVPDHGIDPRNGEYIYTSDEYLAAIELLLALSEDGSFFPGSASLNANEARARVPQGVVGMMVQGPWNITEWQKEAPDFDLGVASQPVPNSGDPLPLGYSPVNNANTPWLYAESALGAVAGDAFTYMGSLEGQRAMSSITGGIGDPAVFPEAREEAKENASPEGRKALELAEEIVLLPSAIVRNPDGVEQVSSELEPVSPGLGEVVQGIFVGEIEDPRQAMQDLKDRSEQELDRAIEAARSQGAEVSREDWVFPNWDPRQDYAEEDYASL